MLFRSKLTAVTELSQVCPRNKKNSENDVLEAILGHVGQSEDTGCDDDGVDVSVDVDVGAVLGVGVHGQGVYLSVSLGVGLFVGSPPLTSLDC